MFINDSLTNLLTKIILFLMAYVRPLEIILAKKTTELVLLFYKNITKLVFLWTNMSQNSDCDYLI